ncbi:MAG: IS1634 family transposase [Oligoflexia bacterium]|nr:IS1634 family transposase [Oligoflexia bacterium]
MSYKIEQKIGKNTYVYEVQSYWDKKLKKTRQNKVYIGKKDKSTGKTYKKLKSTPKLAKDFGCLYFFNELVKKIGIADIIKKIYPDIHDSLIDLLTFKLSERKPLYLFETWVDNAEINGCDKLSSARISDIMISLGKDEVAREHFLRNWIAINSKNNNLFYDITSFSTFSEMIDLFEWGHNRDKESLPQINLGVLIAHPSCMPLFYEVYPGSITDVVTIVNILKRLHAYKLKNFTLVLDRGFYSERNILEIYKVCDFIIPMPFTNDISKKLLKSTSSILESPLISKVVHLEGDRTVFCEKKTFKINNKIFYAHIFVDNEKKIKTMNNLFQTIHELEKNFNNSLITKIKDAKLFFDTKKQKEYMEYFKIVKKGRKYYLVKNDDHNIQNLVDRMGKTILLTKDKNICSTELINKYFRRDIIEKAFDDLKNELNEKELRAHNKYSLLGRMFFNFIALIVQSYCLEVMRKNEEIKSSTVEEILNELKKIRCVSMLNGDKYVTEITKTQKDIFKAFKIKLPLEPGNKISAFQVPIDSVNATIIRD